MIRIMRLDENAAQETRACSSTEKALLGKQSSGSEATHGATRGCERTGRGLNPGHFTGYSRGSPEH
jgi:hypothetical protein